MRGLAAAVAAALAALAQGSAAAPAAGVAAAASAGPGQSRVSYLAGGAVYIESGRLAGLAPGDTLAVLRGGRVIGRLLVRDLSSNRAACDTLATALFPQVGDEVRFTPHALGEPAPPIPALPVAADTAAGAGAETTWTAPAPAGPAPATPAPVPAPAPRAARAVRGRAGGQLLNLSPSGSSGFSQAALDLRLEATRVGDSPVDASVDVRGHRTYFTGGATPDYGRARVYRLAASVHDSAGYTRLTVGRQTSPSLVAVSLMDGALAQYGRERWGAGLFAGAEPDPVSYGLSSDVIDGGGFLEVRSPSLAAARWTLTTGFVSSLARGHVNRDFLFLQGFWSNRRLWASLAEELDLALGWKRTAGAPALSLTSTFATARYQVTRALDLHAGYDDRRDVRLYRDQVTPETEFDDHHRRGGWAGASLTAGRHLRLGAEGRVSGGSSWGTSRSYTGSADLTRLAPLGVDLRWRTTRTTGDETAGWLHSGGLTLHPYRDTALEFSGGLRLTEDVFSGLSSRIEWEGASLEVPLARSWYFLFSLEHDHGDTPSQLQSFTSVSWLF